MASSPPGFLGTSAVCGDISSHRVNTKIENILMNACDPDAMVQTVPDVIQYEGVAELGAEVDRGINNIFGSLSEYLSGNMSMQKFP